jgi:ketosteroid isomerase-like protein
MRWKLWSPCIVLLALAGTAGCERAAEPEGEFPQVVADGWLGAFNSGDIDGIMLMYSDDAELLPPDQPIIAGREAIKSFWQSYNPGQIRIEVSEVTSERLGPYWFREGTYAAIFPDEGEPRVGKFIELWKKADTNWLLYRHMWSRNSPAPAEMPDVAPAA